MAADKPIDLTAHRIPELLAVWDTDPDTLAAAAVHDRFSPTTAAGLQLATLTETEQRIPRHYRGAVPDHPQLLAWARAVVADAHATQGYRPVPWIGDAPSLLLLGPTGVGKTYSAYGTVRLVAAAGVRTGWQAVSAPDLYALLRPRHGVDSEAEFRKVAQAPLLLLDDVGAGKASEWTEEVNYRLINYRYEADLPTLITSNVAPRELGAELGARVASRIAEMCEQVTLKGPDRRALRMRAA